MKKTLISLIFVMFGALAMGQSTAVNFFNQGKEQMLRGNIAGAEALFTKAIEYNENYAEAYIERGLTRWYLSRFGGAMEDYNKAIQLKPELARSKNLRAIFRELFEDYEDIINDFEYTITVDTNEYKAYDGREFVQLISGNVVKEFNKYDEAVRANPEEASNYSRRALASFYLDDYEDVIEDCNTALQLNSELAWPLFIRGNTYAKMEDYRNSIMDYYNFEKKISDFPVLFLNRGIVNKKMGNDYQAMEDFEKAIKLRPDFYQAKYFHAKMLGENSLLDEAIAELSEVINNQPGNTGAFVHRGLFYKQQINYIEALSDYDKVLKQDNGLSKAYHNRANLRVLINDLEGALEDYNMAISIDDTLEKSFFNRGVLKFLRGDPDSGCVDIWLSYDLGYDEALEKAEKYCR